MNPTPSVLSSAFQMLTALGIILGGLLVVYYVMKRYLKRDGGSSSGQLIQVIASQYIGIKKHIALVKIPGAILALGISNDKISLLTKIEDQAILEEILQESSGTSPTFSEHLQRLSTRFKSAQSGK